MLLRSEATVGSIKKRVIKFFTRKEALTYIRGCLLA